MSGGVEPLFSLAGRVVVVTGGTRGIGGAISRRFAQAGAHVIAGYVRNAAAAAAFTEQLAAEGLTVELCRADASRQGGVDTLVAAVGDRPVHALVHAAATGVHGKLESLGGRHWDFTFAINARGFVELVRALLPRLQPGGSIVALSSEGAVHAVPDYGLVGASKAALESLCRNLAVELADRRIRVNALSPGAVETDAWRALPDAESRLAAARERHPQRRLTTLDEVAGAAQFLCVDASAGVSGTTLVVDGGSRVRESALGARDRSPA